MKIQQLLPLMIMASTLTTCAGGPKVRIADDIRNSIKTVAIDSTVSIPDSMHFSSAKQNISANFGLISMFIGDKDKRGKTDALSSSTVPRSW